MIRIAKKTASFSLPRLPLAHEKSHTKKNKIKAISRFPNNESNQTLDTMFHPSMLSEEKTQSKTKQRRTRIRDHEIHHIARGRQFKILECQKINQNRGNQQRWSTVSDRAAHRHENRKNQDDAHQNRGLRDKHDNKERHHADEDQSQQAKQYKVSFLIHFLNPLSHHGRRTRRATAMMACATPGHMQTVNPFLDILTVDAFSRIRFGIFPLIGQRRRNKEKINQ